MLSFGIDASFALRIAFSSGAFAAGSPPPSRAATMIARASFEKCAPRRESTTAFLCLMLAHFECPDIRGVYEFAVRAPRRAGGARPRSRGRRRHRIPSRVGASPTPEIFKAYDIRGLYPEQIDADLAERIGRAFALVLSELESK